METTTSSTTLCQFEEQTEPRTVTSDHLSPLSGQSWTGVKEKQFKNSFDVFDGAPSEWALDRGATHTLWLGECWTKGSRPAKLLKTVMWVGVDEDENGEMVWEKWQIKTEGRRTADQKEKGINKGCWLDF